MTLIVKPDYSNIWSSGGGTVTPANTKIQQGWTAEVPPFQYENWIQNRQDTFIAHVNQRGIAAWDALTEYEAGSLSYVQGTDGKIYKSVAASGPSTVSQNPVTDSVDTYWTIAFAEAAAYLTQASGDNRYLVKTLNGSDISNASTFLANIGGASKVSPTFTGVPLVPTAATGTNTTQIASTAFVKLSGGLLDSVRTDVASASTVNLTTAAPNTRHIQITGASDITAFTVAAGQCYFVSFSGAVTLTNGASLVTQTGSNIKTAAGDTCVIRATANNIVEVAVFSKAVPVFGFEVVTTSSAFIVPDNVYKLKYKVYGGGGGGGGVGSTGAGGAGGGGGGGSSEGILSVTPGQSITVTIGAAGAAGGAGSGGGTGGTTILFSGTNLAAATGGQGGGSNGAGGAGGAGGSGTVGALLLSGGQGSTTGGAVNAIGGMGANSTGSTVSGGGFGVGGPGRVPGGGGAGTGSQNATGGGAGARGQVNLEW
jgi:hypothetical protein